MSLSVFIYMISIYYIIITNKQKKEFLSNMQDFSTNNPDKVVSIEEVGRILNKFNKTYIKPFNILITLTIIATSFLVLTALLIIFSINYQY